MQKVTDVATEGQEGRREREREGGREERREKKDDKGVLIREVPL